jgi:hypothetical protein
MRRRGRKTHARPCTQPLLETEFELLLREFAPAPSGALKRTRMVQSPPALRSRAVQDCIGRAVRPSQKWRFHDLIETAD